MALPFLLGAAAAAAGLIGAGAAIDGASQMKKANDTMKETEARHKGNIARFENENNKTTKLMDEVGKKELEVLDSFEEFTSLIELIHNKPEFKAYNKNGVNIPQYNPEELKKVSVGAGVLMGGVGGAAAGTAGGFAASGAAYSAVMALGAASTGTPIAALSGAAATNATLAALGGGSLAAGGGGMALGTTILNATTLGMGLLVGGILFNVTGTKLSNKAEEAKAQMLKAEKDINKICDYLSELYFNAKRFKESLSRATYAYKEKLYELKCLIQIDKKFNWADYTQEEKLLVENTVLLVGLLYSMCQTKLVLKDTDNDELNEVNVYAIDKSINDAHSVLTQIA